MLHFQLTSWKYAYLHTLRVLLLCKNIHSQTLQIIGNRLDKLYSKEILICFPFFGLFLTRLGHSANYKVEHAIKLLHIVTTLESGSD